VGSPIRLLGGFHKPSAICENESRVQWRGANQAPDPSLVQSGYVPAFSAEAEKAILGILLIDNTRIPAALDALTPNDFYLPYARSVFEAMGTLVTRRENVNQGTLTGLLNGDLSGVGGGATFLSECEAAVMTTHALTATSAL